MKISEFALPRTDQEEAEADIDAPAEVRQPHFFSRFFKAEWPRLRTFIRRFVRDDEADELAQETFARFYAAPGEIRSPSSHLYRTARNLLIDRQRARNRAAKVLLEEVSAEAVPDPRASPEDEVDWRQRLERATVVLDRMTPKCRRVFLLHIVDGYKYSEIAAELEMSVIAVKKQLLRAYEICAAYAEEEERSAGRRRGLRPRRAADK